MSEAMEQAEKAKEAAGEDRKIALLISVIALCLALSETLGKGAQTESISKNVEASNFWAFFQAKSIRRTVLQTAAEQGKLGLGAAGDDAAKAAVQKQIDDLEKEMQKLDPSRFPGNPAMVEELHAKVLNDVDKLELQWRRDPNQPQAGQVRTAKTASVPAGYEDAVAEYYRRLGKGQ